MGREGLEVRVQVLEPVLGIDEPVHAAAGRVEGVVDVDLDAVVAVRAPRREPQPVASMVRLDRRAR